MKMLLALAFYFCGIVHAFAFTIYISPQGNDHNPGTRDKPLASLQAACDKARSLRKSQVLNEPVVIQVAPGTYMLSAPFLLTAADAGTERSPLIIRGQAGAETVFTGGKQLPSFKRISDKLWEADIPDIAEYGGAFEQLYVNGQRAVRARTPNEGSFYKVMRTKETVITPGGRFAKQASEKIVVQPGDISWMQALKGDDTSDVVITFYHNWDITRKHPQRISIEDTALYLTGEGMKPWNPINEHSIYMAENAKAFLDAPGEWFLDRSGKLYYIPRAGETIGHTAATAPVLEQFIVLKGEAGKPVQHIRFENIAFRYAAYHLPAGGNEPSQAAASVDATIMADFAAHISFTNCEIAHTGIYACWFRKACSDCSIMHCYLHDLGAGGVKIGDLTIPADTQQLTQHITLDNNIIRSGGYVFQTGTGVLIFHASDNTITHNEIADFGYSGVSVGWVWGYSYSPSKRNNISFNDIHHLGWGILSDMGGVYTLGKSEGTVVSNNVIHDVFSRDYGGWGLYTDEGSTGIVMENNLVYHCKSSAFHQHYGENNVLSNNIFASQVKAQLEATRIEEHLSFTFTHNIIYFSQGNLFDKAWADVHFRADSNCYWDTRTPDIRFGKQSFSEWKQSGKDTHSIIADPQFADPAKQDFRIRNKSVLAAIGFRPFDPGKAGVYGSKSWIRLARFDEQIAQRFAAVVKENSD